MFKVWADAMPGPLAGAKDLELVPSPQIAMLAHHMGVPITMALLRKAVKADNAAYVAW